MLYFSLERVQEQAWIHVLHSLLLPRTGKYECLNRGINERSRKPGGGRTRSSLSPIPDDVNAKADTFNIYTPCLLLYPGQRSVT